MKDNSEQDIPYVSKELCAYLRERFSLQNLMHRHNASENADRALGAMIGANAIIETLEEIHIMQEERDGIHR